MKLVPSRPVTIHAVRNGERWFTFMFRHTNGKLFLYTENGHDASFAPMLCLSSNDGGRIWLEEEQRVPRTAWTHSFADGEIFEVDSHGVLDPKDKNTFCFYGAWSNPAKPTMPVRKSIVRVHAPSSETIPLVKMPSIFPTYPWWPLFNELHGKDQVAPEDILIGGPTLTSGIEHEDSLLAMGYLVTGRSTHDLYCFESSDRGQTWQERSLVARWKKGLDEGFNESTLVSLKNGQLYTAIRTGEFLFHAWSDDGGLTWTPPEQMHLVDSSIMPGMVWPVCKVLEDGTLVMVYGRPGKDMIFDPSGTGKQWQGHLDLHAWEMDTQALMGVPSERRLCATPMRFWDSGNYLSLVPVGPREMLVTYDVQNYHEHWNAVPVSGIRMVRVRLED
jgi:hypothetical protein